MSGKKTILSGMRSTGKLHLGNLLGALQNWVKLQDDYNCFFMVADWHALTTESRRTKEIAAFAREMVVDWLVAGIDPKKSTVFVQSAVLEHAELHLLLSMITPIPWLERNPTYKSQMNELKEKDLSNYGFLGYPVLQAADILVYKASVVPIGQDQLPHLEISREICRRFNNFYGDVFPEPQHVFTSVPALLGIDGRKMSKSYDNCINMSDTKEAVEKKIKKCYTDPKKIRRGDPGDSSGCPIFLLHNIYRKDKAAEIDSGCRSGALGCADCKKALLEILLPVFDGMQEKRSQILGKAGFVGDVLSDGNKRAKAAASKTMEEVRNAIFGKGHV